jgi:hypothetical protein
VGTLPEFSGYFRNRNMIENEKIDCVDSLIFGLNRTAQWRQKMAAQYPGDPRNVRAADCLLKLASDATELSDGTPRRPTCPSPASGWSSLTTP